MKKVLVIVYYWPPSGGGGVQRWVKFTKYLPELGWEPIVFAPQDADYPLMDVSLEKEVSKNLAVIKRPIFEPRKLYRRWLGKANEVKNTASADEIFYIPAKERSLKQKLSLWVRGNLFIPDARMFWIAPSVRYLKKYLKSNPVDVIVTTGPPHSVHLIGKALHKKLQIPWVADFRDPWTEIEFYDKMMLSKWADKKHRRLEREVIQQASAVSMVTYYWADKFLKMGAKRTATITNGYDDTDFGPHTDGPLSKHFLLSHIGTLANDRNPAGLWQVLQEICDENEGFKKDLRIQLVGKTDPAVWKSMEAYGLADNGIDGGYVDHESAVRLMKTSQLLLLLINQSAQNAPGRMTGKIFEYLASKRPILCIGQEESDPARVLAETKGGVTCDFDNLEKLKKQILSYYEQFQAQDLHVQSDDYQQFSRINMSKKLAELMEQILIKKNL